MKIAMLGHKRIPSREGGVEIVIVESCIETSKSYLLNPLKYGLLQI